MFCFRNSFFQVFLISCVCVALNNGDELIKCCKSVPRLVSDDLIKECFVSGQKNESSNLRDIYKKIICGNGCIFEKMNVMNGANVDMDKLKAYIGEHFADNAVAKKMFEDAFKECLPTMDSWIESMNAYLKSKDIEFEPECKINSFPIGICLAHAQMEKCPDFDDSNEECKSGKQFIFDTYQKFVTGKYDE